MLNDVEQVPRQALVVRLHPDAFLRGNTEPVERGDDLARHHLPVGHDALIVDVV